MAGNYWDYDTLARFDPNGQLRIFTAHAAVENALRNWFRSFEKEYIRQPKKGGVLTSILTKPMSEESGKELKATIREKLLYDFIPSVRVIKIDTNPMYESNYWDIYIEGYIPAIKEKIKFADKIKNLV